jgi:uncharacterized protein YcgI (DUF1989 family)
MTEPSLAPGEIVLDAVVPPGRPWGHRVAQGDILRLIDLEGQQAVDFLCYDVEDPTDRYCATNTIKVQGKLFVGKGTVLYSDLGKALFTVVEDTCGRHDTIYGCCSEPNNLTSCATASAAHIAALAISSKRWRSSGSTAAISSAMSISS